MRRDEPGRDRDLRINTEIRASYVMVIDAQGTQLGTLDVRSALAKAREAALDLVEVSPSARPPVCRIMDFGKYKYELRKKQREARKRQTVVHVKELKLGLKTGEHDYRYKIDHFRKFLSEGHKAKVTIVFRGREITHGELGQELLRRVVDDLKGVGAVEQFPRLEGKTLTMLIAPLHRKGQRPATGEAPAEGAPPRPAPMAPPAPGGPVPTRVGGAGGGPPPGRT